MEARSLAGWSTSRHCIITKALDLTPESFQTIRQKAGALVVVLPKDLDKLGDEERQVINLIYQIDCCALNSFYVRKFNEYFLL